MWNAAVVTYLPHAPEKKLSILRRLVEIWLIRTYQIKLNVN